MSSGTGFKSVKHRRKPFILTRDHATAIATANVDTLNVDGKLELLCRDLQTRNIEICGLCETRLQDSDDTRELHVLPAPPSVHSAGSRARDRDAAHTGDAPATAATQPWQLLNSGWNCKQRGVGLLLSPTACRALLSWQRVNERLLTAKFRLPQRKCLTIIQAYAPTSTKQHEQDSVIFYAQLQQLVDKVPARDSLLRLGDFNAQLGTTSGEWSSVRGLWGHGQPGDTPCDNGLKLLSFCASNGLAITNTFFRHKPAHKATWYHPSGKSTTMIDYAITRRSDLPQVRDTRTLRGIHVSAGVHGHRLVVCKLAAHLRRQRQGAQRRVPQYDVAKLHSRDTAEAYCLHLQNRFSSLPADVADPDTEWQHLQQHVTAAASSAIGHTTAKRQPPWLSQRTVQLAAAKQVAFQKWQQQPSANSYAAWRLANNLTKASAKRDKNAHLATQAKRFDSAMQRGRTHEAYAMVKSMTGSQAAGAFSGPLLSADGTLLEDEPAKLARMRERYQRVLNVPSTAAAGLHRIPTPKTCSSAPRADERPPSLAEVELALQRLQNHKAPGLDGIPSELLKGGGAISAAWLQRIIGQV